jgi:hypothetical protein
MKNSLPLPQIEQVGRFLVVRDDILPGGTKMRYMLPLLQTIKEDIIIYASPAQGYAQIALAHVCKMLNKQAVVFVAKRKDMHPRTLAAKEAGATIIEVPHGYLNVVQSKAREYALQTGGLVVPFGVDVPEAIQYFAEVAKQLDINPTEVWACSGSGTLIRGLQEAWPNASFNSVAVGKSPNVGNAKLWIAPEKFEQPAKIRPPYPSADNYDAKIWRFVEEHGSDGALIWNVGK